MTAPRLLYQHCASPPIASCAPLPGGTRCWLCGGAATRGVSRGDWMGAGFVGQNRVRAKMAEHVCEPCVWVCARRSPVPGRPPKEGKRLGGNFRNYSHLYDEAMAPAYVTASKAEKAVILAFLRRPHVGRWFAAIAESGQKHVVPFAPVNPAGAMGRVLFEEAEVTLPRAAASWQIADDLADLLAQGAPKREVAAGDYSPRMWRAAGDAVRAFEARHGMLRGGAWFDLVLWATAAPAQGAPDDA